MTIWRFFLELYIESITVMIILQMAPSFFNTDENEHVSKEQSIVSIVMILINTTVSIVSGNPFIYLISMILGLSVLSFYYEATNFCRVKFVVCIAINRCVTDYFVYMIFGKPYDNIFAIGLSSIVSLLLFFTLKLLIERMHQDEKEAIGSQHWISYYVSVLICIATSLFLVTDKNASPLSISVVCGSFLATNLIIIHILEDLIQFSVKVKENAILQDQITIFEKEIELSHKNDNSLKAFRHDMKHHFAEMSALVNTGQIDHLKTYLKDINGSFIEVLPLSCTGNESIDTVLNYMLKKAKDKKIDVSSKVVVPETLKLSIVDMTIILGNLLENAIEATEKTDHPLIDLNIIYSEGNLAIEVSNTFNGTIHEDDFGLASTKETRANHGYGLKNIKKILEKYPSSYDYKWDSERFTADILMFLSR